MENSQSFCKCYESTILCIDFNFFPQQYFMQDQVFAMVIDQAGSSLSSAPWLSEERKREPLVPLVIGE